MGTVRSAVNIVVPVLTALAPPPSYGPCLAAASTGFPLQVEEVVAAGRYYLPFRLRQQTAGSSASWRRSLTLPLLRVLFIDRQERRRE